MYTKFKEQFITRLAVFGYASFQTIINEQVEAEGGKLPIPYAARQIQKLQ